MVHRHPPSSLALGPFGIRCVEGTRLRSFKLQLRDVAVQEDETLLAQQNPVGETQPLELALWAASPWSEVSDRDRQGLECF